MMKRNDITALREKTVSQLQAQLEELTLELAKVSLELHAGKLSDVRRPSKIRDDIAHIKTVLSLRPATVKDRQNNKKSNKEAAVTKENK